MLARLADQDPLFLLLALSIDAGLIAFAAWAMVQRLRLRLAIVRASR